ncbi:uncharacterized protein [Antedon mediterranea]|uniref:uncharacterized protein n=1 Tax=Antedon mediterranea TaxID=105859 RepID=UPI003AF44EAC
MASCITTFAIVALAVLALSRQSIAVPATSNPLQVAATFLDASDCELFANRRRLLHNIEPFASDSTDTCYEMLSSVVVTPNGNYRRQDWNALKSFVANKNPIISNMLSVMPVSLE